MGNPFLFADRFSGAVVHLTTGSLSATFTTNYQLPTTNHKIGIPCCIAKTGFRLARFAGKNDKMPASANWRRHFD
jgi:hypothetical protein